MTAGANPSEGRARIEWADGQMPVLRSIRERLAAEHPLGGLRVGACLHVTAETACLVRTLVAGGAEVALAAANPLTTQDEVVAALVADGCETHGRRGEDADAYAAGVIAVVDGAPQVTLDDGADLLTVLHAARPELLGGLVGGTEETTTGLVRLRALEAEGRLACPVIAVNEARTERLFNDHYGTGQSTLDGILRATNLLLAGRTLVVLGYGWTGKGVALRARGGGAHGGVRGDAGAGGGRARRHLRHGHRQPRRSLARAFRAHEGRRGAGQRGPLRRRDRPRGAARRGRGTARGAAARDAVRRRRPAPEPARVRAGRQP